MQIIDKSIKPQMPTKLHTQPKYKTKSSSIFITTPNLQNPSSNSSKNLSNTKYWGKKLKSHIENSDRTLKEFIKSNTLTLQVSLIKIN